MAFRWLLGASLAVVRPGMRSMGPFRLSFLFAVGLAGVSLAKGTSLISMGLVCASGPFLRARCTCYCGTLTKVGLTIA
eukprot:3615090-Amphidinium_carterae.1